MANHWRISSPEIRFGVRRQQAGDVMGGGRHVVDDRAQGRDRLSDPLAILIGLYDELGYSPCPRPSPRR